MSSGNASGNSTIWYRTPIYKAIAIIGFLIIMAFPQPEWLSTILTHPIGGILLAWGVGLALIPELEWWVIGLGVLAGYIILALSGLIETNLQNKRQAIQKKEDEKAEKKAAEEEEESEERGHGMMMEEDYTNHPMQMHNQVQRYESMMPQPMPAF